MDPFGELATACRQRGIEVREDEKVLALRREGGGVRIETERGSYHARAVIGADGSGSMARRELVAGGRQCIGKAVMAFVIKPIGPSGTPPAESPPPGPTVERGAYLVRVVAECTGCHTERSHLDGSYTGPLLAGGTPIDAEGAPGLVAVPPNLTPEPRTGRIAAWSEDQFVARFRHGKLIPQSPMPWGAFTRMTDDDLRAIYRYLRTVPPVVHDPGPSLRRSE